MEIPEGLHERIDQWTSLSRWEQSEVGRDLRRLGLSYGEIQQHIEVKKSTLATWCRAISLSPKMAASIVDRTGSRKGIPRNTQRKRRAEITDIRRRAADSVAELVQDPVFPAGLVLYWAEGNKTTSTLGLSNSDPRAIRLFIGWCRRFHAVDSEFTLKLNLHSGNDEGAARRWWTAQTGLENAEFHKTFVKPDGTGHRKNHLANGVCMVRMRRSADALHRTLGWIEGLAAQFDIDSP